MSLRTILSLTLHAWPLLMHGPGESKKSEPSPVGAGSDFCFWGIMQAARHRLALCSTDGSLNTVAKYYDAKYNNTEEYQLLMQYNHSVKTGWLSPLAGFDLYMETHNRIQTELVGKTTADGTVITGHTIHFMERVFGTMVDPDKLKYGLKIIRRSGVGYDDMFDTLFNPEHIDPLQISKNGKRSVRLRGKAVVTINPDTGQLIQLNPRGEK